MSVCVLDVNHKLELWKKIIDFTAGNIIMLKGIKVNFNHWIHKLIDFMYSWNFYQKKNP